jgi:hypothetical protein
MVVHAETSNVLLTCSCLQQAHAENSAPTCCCAGPSVSTLCLCESGLKQRQLAAGDVVVLTPYVGQLMEIRRQLAGSRFTVLLNDRDREAMAQLDEGVPRPSW